MNLGGCESKLLWPILTCIPAIHYRAGMVNLNATNSEARKQLKEDKNCYRITYKNIENGKYLYCPSA
jgi:hypothetical protein